MIKFLELVFLILIIFAFLWNYNPEAIKNFKVEKITEQTIEAINNIKDFFSVVDNKITYLDEKKQKVQESFNKIKEGGGELQKSFNKIEEAVTSFDSGKTKIIEGVKEFKN